MSSTEAAEGGDLSLALRVDDHETAVQTLTRLGYTIFTENDLSH